MTITVKYVSKYKDIRALRDPVRIGELLQVFAWLELQGGEYVLYNQMRTWLHYTSSQMWASSGRPYLDRTNDLSFMQVLGEPEYITFESESVACIFLLTFPHMVQVFKEDKVKT